MSAIPSFPVGYSSATITIPPSHGTRGAVKRSADHSEDPSSKRPRAMSQFAMDISSSYSEVSPKLFSSNARIRDAYEKLDRFFKEKDALVLKVSQQQKPSMRSFTVSDRITTWKYVLEKVAHAKTATLRGTDKATKAAIRSLDTPVVQDALQALVDLDGILTGGIEPFLERLKCLDPSHHKKSMGFSGDELGAGSGSAILATTASTIACTGAAAYGVGCAVLGGPLVVVPAVGLGAYAVGSYASRQYKASFAPLAETTKVYGKAIDTLAKYLDTKRWVVAAFLGLQSDIYYQERKEELTKVSTCGRRHFREEVLGDIQLIREGGRFMPQTAALIDFEQHVNKINPR